MASSSNRKSGSSGRSNPRKRVVIGAHETTRVRYDHDEPVVESERAARGRGGSSRVKREAAGAAREARVRRAAAGTGRETHGGRERGSGKSTHAKAPRSAQGKRLAAAKRDERERRQRALRLRRALAAGIVVVMAAAVVFGVVAFARSAAFAVTTVEVAGTRHLSPDDVRRLAAIPEGSTLFTLSGGAVERRVAASPWVSEARVDRDFPHTLRIQVVEREPVAVVDAGGSELWVVSRDGWWLGERSAAESGTIVIRDVEGVRAQPGRKVTVREVSNAARLAAGLSAPMRQLTAYISAPSVEKTAVITDDEVEIYFGEAEDVPTKERIARELLESEKGKVVYINVRVVESPTWRGIDE